MFEHAEETGFQESSKQAAQSTLRELCRQTSQGVRPETPALFAQLVKNLKKLDAQSLIAIQRGASSICPKAR